MEGRFSSSAPSPGAPSAGSLETLLADWARLWNLHDMNGAAGLVAADVDFVNVAGKWLRGREEFLSHHLAIHRAQMRNSVWINLGHQIRQLHGDLAVVHLEWAIHGDLEVDGSPRLPRRGVFTWVTALHEGHWLILVAHNTDLREGVTHVLPSSAPSFRVPNLETGS